jgi:hypothetical protein
MNNADPDAAGGKVLPLHPALGILGAILLPLSLVLALLEIRFFAIYAYEIAWWSLIGLLDGVLWRRRGRSPLTAAPLSFLLLCLWSVAFWFVFELINLRLENWYYIYVWRSTGMRWLISFVAFATVLPGVYLMAEVIRSFVPAAPDREPVRRAPRWLFLLFAGLGLVCLALPLAWPRQAYPLVWLGVYFLLEPLAYRPGGSSLLAEAECGRARSLVLFLAAGLACGLLWELFNHGARVKWIYTVPFFEELKLFEMPAAGFLGFPPFAVECWIFLLALERVGLGVGGSALARGEPGRPRGIGWKLGVALTAAVATCALAIPGMERRTVGCCYPTAAATARHLEVLGLGEVAAQHPGRDAFSLGHALRREPPSGPRDRALAFLDLATLAGIGLEKAAVLHDLGIRTTGSLARADDERLLREMKPRVERLRLTGAEIRVWIRAARRRPRAD